MKTFVLLTNVAMLSTLFYMLLLTSQVTQIPASIQTPVEVTTSDMHNDVAIHFNGNGNVSEIGEMGRPRESIFTFNCSSGGNPYCLNFPMPLLIRPQNICHVESPIYLLMIITSKNNNFVKRQVIRDSWAGVSDPQYPVRHVFLLGRSSLGNTTQRNMIDEESRKYGDILQGDITERYRNLTAKTIMGYTWMRKYCPGAKYVLKTDDDIYVNTRALLSYLDQNVQYKSPTIIGRCFMQHDWVRRNRTHRWHLSRDNYPDEYFPPYCCGCGYVITGSTARDLGEVVKWIPTFAIEDAFIGVAIKRLSYAVKFQSSTSRFDKRSLTDFKIICRGLASGRLFTLHGPPVSAMRDYHEKCAFKSMGVKFSLITSEEFKHLRSNILTFSHYSRKATSNHNNYTRIIPVKGRRRTKTASTDHHKHNRYETHIDRQIKVKPNHWQIDKF